MSDDNLPEEFPNPEWDTPRTNTHREPDAASTAENDPARESRFSFPLQRLADLGLAEPALRIGTHLLSIALVLLVVWVMREFYLSFQVSNPPRQPAQAAAAPTATPTAVVPELPTLASAGGPYLFGIPRLALMHTTIPTRPRTEVIPYTVQPGDTVFGIA